MMLISGWQEAEEYSKQVAKDSCDGMYNMQWKIVGAHENE